MTSSSCALALSSFQLQSGPIHDIKTTTHAFAAVLSNQCVVESWLDHSTRKRCDNHLSVGENWHCANSGPECICEEGFFTEWKLGNTPNEKPRNPAFGGVFFLSVDSLMPRR